MSIIKKYYIDDPGTYLIHHGVKGQRWGIRRFQNEDGSLTPTGEKRYGTVENMNETRARNKKRAIGVGIGVGVAAAVTGGIILTRKNKQLKKELGGYKDKEAKMLANLDAGRKKRLENIAAGIKTPKKIKIKPGSTVTINETTKMGDSLIKELINVGGGYVMKGSN